MLIKSIKSLIKRKSFMHSQGVKINLKPRLSLCTLISWREEFLSQDWHPFCVSSITLIEPRMEKNRCTIGYLHMFSRQTDFIWWRQHTHTHTHTLHCNKNPYSVVVKDFLAFNLFLVNIRAKRWLPIEISGAIIEAWGYVILKLDQDTFLILSHFPFR